MTGTVSIVKHWDTMSFEDEFIILFYFVLFYFILFYFILFYFIFNVYLFLRQRETEHEQRRVKERGRHRI